MSIDVQSITCFGARIAQKPELDVQCQKRSQCKRWIDQRSVEHFYQPWAPRAEYLCRDNRYSEFIPFKQEEVPL